MAAYIARRLLLMIPTILGILLISFVIVQFAPGGPVERVLAQLQGLDSGATSRFGGGATDLGAAAQGGGEVSQLLCREIEIDSGGMDRIAIEPVSLGIVQQPPA